MPATCNEGCASVFIPFFHECAEQLGSQAQQFRQVLNLCEASRSGNGADDGETRPNSRWHGGQWLIPEIQTDTTGIVCDWATNPELLYITAVLDALDTLGAAGGGRLFDLDRLFFTGCSMGSALTVWIQTLCIETNSH